MKISDIDLRALLPEFLQRDASGVAMVDALTPQLRELARQARNALIFPRVDELSGDILDALAVELDIAWYTPNADVWTKRAIIRDAYNVHAHFGTPWAVERAAQLYFGNATLYEWWEYAGEYPPLPYHFCVYTTNAEMATRRDETLMRIMDQVKNARSVFDGLVIEFSANDGNVYVGAAVQNVETVRMRSEEWPWPF